MTQSLAAYLVDDTTLMSIAFAPEVFESKMTLDNYQLKTEEGQELSKKVKAKEKCKPRKPPTFLFYNTKKNQQMKGNTISSTIVLQKDL